MVVQLSIPLTLKKANINKWCADKARDCNWANIYPNYNKCTLKEFSPENVICPFGQKFCEDITPKDWKNLLKPLDK